MSPSNEGAEQMQLNGSAGTTGSLGSQQLQPQPQPSPSPAPLAADQRQGLSQSQSQSQLSSKSEPASVAQPAPGPPMPYDYEYVTDEAAEAWASAGRQKLLEYGMEAKTQQDTVSLAAIYQELIRSAIYGRLSPTDAGAVVKDIIGEDVAAQDVDMDSNGQGA